MDNSEEHENLLSTKRHENTGGHIPESKSDNRKASSRNLKSYFDSLLRHSSVESRGKSPVPLLSRPASPEEAPLLEAQSRNGSTSRSRTQSSGTRHSNASQPLANGDGPLSQSSRSTSLAYLSLFGLTFILIASAPTLFSYFYNDLKDNQLCVNSIYFATNALSFSDAEGSFWNTTCQSPLKVTSMYAAAKVYCPSSDIEPGFQAVRNDCVKQGDVGLLDLAPIAASLTAEVIASLRVVAEDLPSDTVLSEVVLVDEAWFRKAEKTVRTWYWTTERHHAYGFALYIFWGVIVACGIAGNAWNTFSSRQALGGPRDEEGKSRHVNRSRSIGTAAFESLAHWVRTYVIVPAAFGNHHQRLFYWCTIPSRFDSIVVASFWALSITLSCISYKLFTDNYFWPDIDQQVARYVSDRTGIMSYATIPLIWIFATRNNGFLWATGWSYRTFNIYHRHIARVGTLLAIVHSVGYTYLYLLMGWDQYVKAITAKWLLLGAVATVTMSLLWVCSHAWIRVKFYESFLLIHIALSVVTLIGLFAHTVIFDGQYDSYLWPAVIIWCCDRVLRLVRIAYCNFRVRFSRDVAHCTETTATYNKDSDVVRLEVRPAAANVLPVPGQFYYIYQPSTWTGWENHPFTLGAWSTERLQHREHFDGDDEAEDKRTSRRSSSSSSSFDVVSAPSASSSRESLVPNYTTSTSTTSSPKKPSLIFWVRPYDGWTKHLRNACLRSPTGVAHPRLLLEGPYGHTYPLHSCDTVLLIAGGTGIASAVPYILSHISRSKPATSEQGGESSCRTTKMHLIWTARQKAFIEDVCAAELAPALGREDFAAEFFTTRPPSRAPVSELFSATPSEQLPVEHKAELAHIEIRHERPDIRSIILETAEDEGRVVVLVCGPAGMADMSRAAVAEAMRRGSRDVRYFEEAFGW